MVRVVDTQVTMNGSAQNLLTVLQAAGTDLGTTTRCSKIRVSPNEDAGAEILVKGPLGKTIKRIIAPSGSIPDDYWETSANLPGHNIIDPGQFTITGTNTQKANVTFYIE